MPEILLPRSPIYTRETELICSAPNTILRDGMNRQPTMLQANTPYLVGDTVRPGDLEVLNILSAANASAPLSKMTEEYGGDGVLTLARLQESLAATFGSGASVYGERMGQLQHRVKLYEQALLSYREAKLVGSPLQIGRAESEVQKAFNHLQRVFQVEVQAITADVKSRRGVVLTNQQRGLNIASSSRRPDRLYVQNQVLAHQLVRLTKHTKSLGNGVAFIDFGSRVGHIQNVHAAGEDWHREMFIQSSSFAASAGSAAAVVKVGTATLAAVMMITTLGPVLLVVSGVVIAGSAAAAALTMDDIITSNSGSWYDKIMETLR